MRCKIFIILICLSCRGLKIQAQFYNGSQVEFGKSRIQHKPVEWSFFRYKRFDVFFYAGGRDLSIRAAKASREILREIEDRFGYEIQNRFQVIIFNRLSDLKQTNLGSLSDPKFNTGVANRKVGSKILLYIEDGDVSFQKQIRAGIAEIMLGEFLMGSDLRDRLRTSALMNIPEWYQKGLISMLSESWNTEMDNRIRDGFLHRKYQNLNELTGIDATVAGHSFWYFFAEKYGEGLIPDILDQANANRSIDEGFRMITGMKLKEIIREWVAHFSRPDFLSVPESKYPADNIISGKRKTGYVFSQVKISRDGEQIAWVRNHYGKRTIWMASFGKGKAKKIDMSGYKLADISDCSFPVLAWNPNNKELIWSEEKKSRLRLNYFNLETGKKEFKYIDFVQKIISMDLSPDGQTIVMAASKNGKADLFLFNNSSNQFKQLTDDNWDESEPRWMDDGRSFVFSSNRKNDSLMFRQEVPLFCAAAHDLFLCKTDADGPQFLRLTNTPRVHESNIKPAGKRKLTYLSDQNGIRNRYAGKIDSSIAFVDSIIHYRYFLSAKPITNRSAGIVDDDVQSGGKWAEIRYQNGRYAIHAGSVQDTIPIKNLPLTPWGKILQQETIKREKSESESKKQAEGKIKTIVILGEDKGRESIPEKALSVKADTFKLPRQRVYLTSWYPEYFNTTIDRSFLSQTYQPFTGSGGYINPPLNGLFRIGLSDLFEDYRITAGIRIAGNTSGNEYLMAFQNQKNRLDKTWIFHRQGIQNPFPADEKLVTNTLTYRLKWPFSVVSHLGADFSYRHDRKTYLAADLSGLLRPNEYRHWAQARLDYVFDNTMPLGRYFLNGTRFKATVEYFNQVNEEKKSTMIMGFDWRNYQRIFSGLILATRMAGASSFGPGKVLFYLGGVDNWFFPSFNKSLKIDQSQNYLFQTIATNLRGFSQNIRNGNSFSVVNAELRWNPVKNLFRYPVRSDLLNSLQLIAFTDAGAAFNGPNPWSKKNTFNQTVIENGPLKITLENLKNPLVVGIGWGLRAKLLGYFVRFDFSWGIENGQILPRISYLSFCNDF